MRVSYFLEAYAVANQSCWLLLGYFVALCLVCRVIIYEKHHLVSQFLACVKPCGLQCIGCSDLYELRN